MSSNSESSTWKDCFGLFHVLHMIGVFLGMLSLFAGLLEFASGLSGTPPTWAYKFIQDPIVFKSASDVSSAANGASWAYILCFFASFIPFVVDLVSLNMDGEGKSEMVAVVLSSWIRLILGVITSAAALSYKQAVLNANCTPEISDPDMGMPLCRNHVRLGKTVWIMPGTLFALSAVPCTATVLVLIWKLCFGAYKCGAYCYVEIDKKVHSIRSAKKESDLENGSYDMVVRKSLDDDARSVSSVTLAEAEGEDGKEKP